MPPRRSTRSSTRLSTEPDGNTQAQKQTPSSKRKRSTVDNTDIDEQEDHDKPPSRTTRRSSTKATASVPSLRTKRSRPSHELEDVYENEEEDTKPTIASRTRRAGSKPVTSSTNGKIGQDQVEDEPDEQVTARPTSRTPSSRKYTNSPKPSTSRRGGRLSRSMAVTVKAEPPDEPALENNDGVDDGELKIPATFQRDISENATAIGPNDDVVAEESTPILNLKKSPSYTPPVYEEKSLLDNLPTSPSKAKRPPLPLEDLQGPRPRLVIHKLVLVNFKSYAGCQEIGPFHRVGCLQCRNIQNSSPVVFLSDCRTQWLGQVEYY